METTELADKMSSPATPLGHIGNLTPDQQAALEKFKQELKDAGAFVEERMTDAWLLR